MPRPIHSILAALAVASLAACGGDAQPERSARGPRSNVVAVASGPTQLVAEALLGADLVRTVAPAGTRMADWRPDDEAIRQMVKDVREGTQTPGQLIIYPEGTRVAPGPPPKYKIGTSVLYAETGQSCIPAATNVGVFWPRTGIYRTPGHAVVEFLPPIQPGLAQDAFMARLEHDVETATNALLDEAGFQREAA